MQSYLHEKPIRTILGLFTPLDFTIRLATKNPIHDAFVNNNPTTRLTFYHEWIHYLQFMSTAIGRRISYSRRVTTLMRLRCLSSCPKPITLPLIKWIEEQKRKKAQIGMFEQLEVIEFNWSNFYTDWSKPIQRIIEMNKQYPFIEYLRKYKPISLDLKEGAFIFRLPDDENIRFQVSPYQICEFMAFAVELDLANRLHYRHHNRPYIDKYFGMEKPKSLIYTMPLLYLNQFASIEPVQFDPAYNPLLTGLIIACYLSLYMEFDLVIRAAKKEGVYKNETGPYKYPGRFLVRLLNCFINNFNIESDDDFIGGKWKHLYDKLCQLINWPSFSNIYKLAWEDVEMDVATLNYQIPELKVDVEQYIVDMKKIMQGLDFNETIKEHRELGFDKDILGILAPVLIKEYIESFKTFATIWDMPEMIAFPYMLFNQRKLSLPIICYPADDGQLMTYRIDKELQKQKGSSISMLDKESAYTLWAYRHFLDKIWYGRDLGCFWLEKGDEFYDSINYCDYSTKEECIARQTKLKEISEYDKKQPKPLEHCINPEWKDLVSYLLSLCGLSLEDVV